MDLSVQKREKFGKAVKSLRREGLIPAELYGRGLKNFHLSVSAKDFLKALKESGTSMVMNLILDGKKTPVLIQDIGRNYLTGEVEHVDFYQVRMDEKIKTKVSLEFIGEAPAVKDKGGILNKAMSEIEVEALPADLPRHLELDLSSLDDIDKSIYVKDIKVPAGVKVLVDADTVVATVTPPVAEEVKVTEEVVDVSAVKVEGEEKRAERAAEKEKTGKEETPAEVEKKKE
jgi:large subunit ribosomal protein L25